MQCSTRTNKKRSSLSIMTSAFAVNTKSNVFGTSSSVKFFPAKREHRKRHLHCIYTRTFTRFNQSLTVELDNRSPRNLSLNSCASLLCLESGFLSRLSISHKNELSLLFLPSRFQYWRHRAGKTIKRSNLSSCFAFFVIR